VQVKRGVGAMLGVLLLGEPSDQRGELRAARGKPRGQIGTGDGQDFPP
jgi:hypothetical protein